MALQRAAFEGVVIPSIEQIVAYKFEKVPVKLIRPRLRDGAYLRAAALLRGLSSDLCFEFCKRVREGKREGHAIVGIDVADSVERVLGCRTQGARARDRQPAGETHSAGRSRLHGSTAEQQQLLRVAAVERQFHDSR